MQPTFILCIFLAIISCNERNKIHLKMNENYEGWIYLLPTRDTVSEREFRHTEEGLVFIPAKYFESNTTVLLKEKGVILKKPINVFNVNFYPRNETKKIFYKKFYYPLDNKVGPSQNIKFFKYNGNKVPEFEYYYYSKLIDSSKLKRFE